MSCAEGVSRRRRFPLAVRAARTPGAPALVFRTEARDPPLPAAAAGATTQTARAITFREFDAWTTSIALGLQARGVGRGDRIALRLPPGPAYPALLLALLRAGAVAVPLSTRLPESALPELLGRSGCRQLIADAASTAAALPGIEILDPALLGAAIGDDLFENVPSPPLPGSWIEGGLPPFDRDADATVVFTSGSTGPPKAALHSFGNHWASAAGANRNTPLRQGDRWLLSLPLWHVGGLAIVFRCLLGGAAVAIPREGEPLADAIPGLGATHASLVATQLYRLLREERGREALRGLKAVLLGGGPAPESLIEEASQAGVRLVTSYGSTEMSSQTTATRPGAPPAALRTAGRPLLFREVALAADGEILVRGRALFRGYLEGGEILPSRDAAGWFHTGDLGRIDADGRLVVAGRLDFMFISGGENIHPEEIERALLRLPGVLEAIVVPVPDDEFGSLPAAFLRSAEGTAPDAAALDRALRATLPGFKVPRRYLPWPDLPEGMKPDRRAFASLARGSGAA